MKRICFVYLLLLLLTETVGQTMNVNYKNGFVQNENVAEIDSITFSENQSVGTISTIASRIDSISSELNAINNLEHSRVFISENYSEYSNSYTSYYVPIDKVKNSSLCHLQDLSFSETGVYYLKFYDDNKMCIGFTTCRDNNAVEVPIGTSEVEVRLRKSMTLADEKLRLQVTGVFGEPEDQVLKYSQVLLDVDTLSNTASSDFAWENCGMAVVKVEEGIDFVWQTDAIGIGLRGQCVAYFDNEHNLIRVNYYPQNSGVTSYLTGYKGFKETAPKGAKTMYVTLYRWDTNTLSSVNAIYMPYSELNSKKFQTNKRKGKRVWLFGDSISATAWQSGESPANVQTDLTTGIGGWISEFMKDVVVRPDYWVNYSRGGYTLSDITADCSGNSYLRMLNQAILDYTNGKIVAPDIVMIAGCTNDIDITPLRNIDKDEIGLSPYPSYDAYAEHSFFTNDDGDYNHRTLIPLKDINKGKIIGAIRYVVEKVGTIFPDCKFMIITPPSHLGKASRINLLV